MKSIVQRVATKAVIVRNGKVLLLREAKTYKDGTNIGKYSFPGGRLDPGERWEEGLRREVTEEAGVTIRIGKPLFVGEWHPVIQAIPHQIVAIFIVCYTESPDIVLSNEHDDAQWVDAASWKTLPVMSPDDEVLRLYFAENNA